MPQLSSFIYSVIPNKISTVSRPVKQKAHQSLRPATSGDPCPCSSSPSTPSATAIEAIRLGLSQFSEGRNQFSLMFPAEVHALLRASRAPVIRLSLPGAFDHPARYFLQSHNIHQSISTSSTPLSEPTHGSAHIERSHHQSRLPLHLGARLVVFLYRIILMSRAHD